MSKAVIVKAKRTPIGKKNGQFQKLMPEKLAAPILQTLGEGMEEINDVILGNVVGPGGNMARLSVLEAGLPLSVPGLTIDRQCSAGLEAIRLACNLIQGGAGTCFLAGGVESTSTSLQQTRPRFSPDTLGDPDMGVAAENVAEKYGVTREKQDAYAIKSYLLTQEAHEQGLFSEEILPIQSIDIDEELVKKRPIERLAKRAKPVFKENGTVTAVNSCGIHDGAAAVLVMEEKQAIAEGLQPVLRFVDSEVAGIHPHFPGAAPIPAIRQLLERNGLTVNDIDLFEINEAFASKIVACAEELSIPYEKLNVRGGALTIGHPYSASGAVLVTRLFYEVQRRKGAKYAVAAIGSGGGIGVAVLFEIV
ncbi:acetyl-CoA C-acetyltransferase [Bacillus ectoiniformans]|uniref:acetyl-CoA C-acyltransferase n=1 Tax=Bacillus ectoiniformans TaxID=1494429 RepID=UPI00195B2C97|nr:acetyl-CoA C-acyltransferase [Bacillus ectoiniformans]MBM7647445.1 acetyl-CoA C-acetyltransferase [Bacillus ectoiniformans]